MRPTILVDSRQQEGKHVKKHGDFEAHGFRLVRSKIAFGDYCRPPKVSIDTKQDIAELAQNIEQDHTRFRNECIAARDAGCKLVILVENKYGITDLCSLSDWTESDSEFRRRKFAKRRISGYKLAKACATMQRKYGVIFDFCHPDEAASRIELILDKFDRRDGDADTA